MYFSKFNAICSTPGNSNLNLLRFNIKSIGSTFNKYFWFIHALCTYPVIRTGDKIVNKKMVSALTELTVEWRRQILSVKEVFPGKCKTKL